MPLGFKVADIYATLNLDKDEMRGALRGLPTTMGADADRAGRELGKKMTDGLAKSVESSAARVTKARRGEVEAAKAVTVAELRLNEARERGKAPASQMLALANSLEKAQYRLSQAQSDTVTSTKKLEDAQKRLGLAMGDVGKGMGPAAQKAGDDAGGKLALGIRMSVIRNSPLIVAAIGAGLAAGGPVMMTAATLLFAGIGIVAAAQSEKVQSAWVGTWEQVKKGAISDAAVIEPVLVKMAGNVGASFERMRPQLRGVFSDAAPQIEVFTRGITDLAENALPGLSRSVAAGMPVTQGFADFLAKTGTGLSDFFDRITAHGPAAGQVWSQLGDSMGALLPTFGELLGQGAELATMVLPLVNTGLGLTLDVVTALGPALPIVVAGFLGMKAAGLAAGFLGSFAAAGQKAVTSMAGGTAVGDRMSSTLGRVSAAAAGGGAGMSALGAGIAVWSGILAYSESQQSRWTNALNEGGAAARKAERDMSGYEQNVGRIGTVLDNSVAKTNIFTAATAWAWELLSNDTDEAREAHDRYMASLSPTEAAQRRLAIAEKELAEALRDHGAGSDEAAAAQKKYDAALKASETANGALELAIEGVTQAMLDQANQAMGAIDADFAYQNSLDQLEDKQKALADAIRDHGRASEEASDAQRAYSEGIWETAQNAAKAAPELDGLKEGTAEYDRAVQNLTLKSLVDMRSGLGPEMQTVVDGMIAKLQAGGASLDELGDKKPTPVVDANIVPLTGKVTDALGQIVNLDGKRPLPGLDLNTGPFNGKTQTSFGLLDVLGDERPTPTADLNTNPFNSGTSWMAGQMNWLGGQRPTPTGQLNTGPFAGNASWMSGHMNWLNGLRASPWATLHANTAAANAQIDWAARNRTAVITTLMTTGNQRGLMAGGKVGSPARRFDIGGSPSRRSDGRISGPGGPFDDLVPAITNMGEAIRVANTEWIINGMVSSRQGDRKMAALNAGAADIVMRPPPGVRRFADGGGLADPLVGGLTTSLEEAFRQVVPTEFYDRMVEAVTVGVEGSLGDASPELTRSIARGAPLVTDAVLRAAPRLTGAVQTAAPAMTWAVSAAGPAVTHAVSAAGPALTQAISIAAGPLSTAIRNALLAGGWRGNPTDGQERLYAPAGGSKVHIFESGRQRDAAYMSWWEGLKAAGWKGRANDGVEALYAPYARGGRFAAGQRMLVGEEGQELVQFDRPGTVTPAPETRDLLSGGGGTRIHIDSVSLVIPGAYNLGTGADKKRLIHEIRDGLVDLERAER